MHKAKLRGPPRPLLLLTTCTVIGLTAIHRQDVGSTAFAPSPQTASDGRLRTTAAEHTAETSRRVLLAGLVAAPIAPMPAEALFGLFESAPPVNTFTVGVQKTINISFPKSYELKRENPTGIVVQGDRVQPADVMSVGVRPANATTLALSVGANATEVGERIANSKQTELVEVKVDPLGNGLDAYQFEFKDTLIHELWLIAVIKRGTEDMYVNVALRTPAALWEEKADQFRTIMASVTPLQNQTATKPVTA